MSAPTTHDPLSVNTRDGVCWERRAVTDSGLGLYAVEGSCKCPPFKMATFAELAGRGIVEWADVLPMPVGPVPRTLDAVEDELTGVSLSLYEEELTAERLRWALASAKRGRARLRARVAELEALELGDPDGRVSATCAEPSHPTWLRSTTDVRGCPWCRIAELEAERHSTNEALDDAVQELRARQSCPCPSADQPGPHQLGCPQAEVFTSERPVNELTSVYMPVAALREALSREEPHDSPLHQAHRLGHDLELPSEADPGDRLLGGDELRRALRGHLFGGGPR